LHIDADIFREDLSLLGVAVVGQIATEQEHIGGSRGLGEEGLENPFRVLV
jgi:hypothetical protein